MSTDVHIHICISLLCGQESNRVNLCTKPGSLVHWYWFTVGWIIATFFSPVFKPVTSSDYSQSSTVLYVWLLVHRDATM